MIGNRTAALGEIDRAVVHELLTGAAGLARACIVDAEPGGQPKRLEARSEKLGEPLTAHGGGRAHADPLAVLPQPPLGPAILPRLGPEHFRPSVGVALALHADQHGSRG